MFEHRKANPAWWLLMLVLTFAMPASAATLSLRAVKVNSVAIAPTNMITVAPGDEIETAIFLSGWGAELPHGVRMYQAMIFGAAAFQSGDNGTILPKGWCAPLSSIDCSDAAMCPPHYPICTNSARFECAGHDPSLGAYIDSTRTDDLCYQRSCLCQVSTSTPNYSYFCLGDDAIGIPDSGLPRYLGTLVLVVRDNACGDFTIGFSSFGSIIADGQPEPTIVYPLSQPLAITVAPCQFIEFPCDPDHCTVDARIPHSPESPVPRFTWDRFVMGFATSAANLTPTDFAVNTIPTTGLTPVIASVTPSGNSADIVLNSRIPSEAWTCIRHIAGNRQCCWGSLPGDANGNLLVRSEDIFELLGNLYGGVVPPLPLEKCDVDRSRLCTPADLLMTVDLFNGAQMFQPYAGATLPACPPMRIRP